MLSCLYIILVAGGDGDDGDFFFIIRPVLCNCCRCCCCCIMLYLAALSRSFCFYYIYMLVLLSLLSSFFFVCSFVFSCTCYLHVGFLASLLIRFLPLHIHIHDACRPGGGQWTQQPSASRPSRAKSRSRRQRCCESCDR